MSMVTPPEVFSGATWPLTFTKAAVDQLELTSYLENLRPRDMRFAEIMLQDGMLTEADMNTLYGLTLQASGMEQVRDSLTAIVDDEAVCHELVLAGLTEYERTQATEPTVQLGFRPNTALQRKTILAIPYEELDSLESFFAATSLLVGAGNEKLITETAERIGILAADVTSQLRYMKESKDSAWFENWQA